MTHFNKDKWSQPTSGKYSILVTSVQIHHKQTSKAILCLRNNGIDQISEVLQVKTYLSVDSM